MKRYILNPNSHAWAYSSYVSILQGETLVVDGDTVSVDDGHAVRGVEFPGRRFVLGFHSVLADAVRGGHLHPTVDNELTQADFTRSLVATALKCSSAIKDAITDAGIEKMDDLCALTRDQLKARTSGLGAQRMKELEDALTGLGRSLKKAETVKTAEPARGE